MIHVHRYGKWQDGTGVMSSPLFHKKWEQPIQIARCVVCGKTKIRYL